MGLLSVVGSALGAKRPPDSESDEPPMPHAIGAGLPDSTASHFGTTIPGAATEEAVSGAAPLGVAPGMELPAQGFSLLPSEPMGLLGAVSSGLSALQPAGAESGNLPASGDAG